MSGPGSWSSDASGVPPETGGPPPPSTPMSPSPPPPGNGTARRDGPAWERRHSLFDLAALFATVRDVLFDAGTTFARLVRDGGLASPLVYLLILGTAGGWIGLLWDTLLTAAWRSFAPAGDAMNPLGIDPVTRNIISALIMPGLVLITFFIISGIVHLFLMIVGGARYGFETTARVVAYASGSTAVFSLIPFCGGVIGFFWGLVVEIIGIAAAHETDTGRATAAVLLPLLLCCLLCCAIVVSVRLAAPGVLNDVLPH